MLTRKHWLEGSSFLPLIHEAIETVERNIADRLDRRGELERPEETITNVLVENLQNSLDAVAKGLRDLQSYRSNQPAVTRFDFTVCDMQAANRDVLGADVAFIFRTAWANEFRSRRGILLQAKRLGPLSDRTLRRLDQESQRVYGVPLTEWEEIFWHLAPHRMRLPPLRRTRMPWPYLPSMLAAGPEDLVLGDFHIDSKQLDELLANVVSSYYLFYDYPIPHMTLPCVQALTVKGLLAAARSTEVYRASMLRHAMSLAELLVNEFIGCRIGEWNSSFEQLEHIADQGRVGPIDTPQGDSNVHAYNVAFVVVLEITLLPSPYEAPP